MESGYNRKNLEKFLPFAADREILPIKGWEGALENISWFKTDSKFYQIDDMYGCLDFVVNVDPEDFFQKGWEVDPDKHYFISIEHEDLNKLRKLGYVKGVKRVTEYDYKYWRYQDILKSMKIKIGEDKRYYLPDGRSYPEDHFSVIKPKKWRYKDDENKDKWCVIPHGYFQLTKKGVRKIRTTSVDFQIRPDVFKRVSPLMKIKYYDSAVREAAIMLELRLKEFNNDVKGYGLPLVAKHLERLKVRFEGESEYLKYYKNYLKSSIKFHRNEYAHGFPLTNKLRAEKLVKMFSQLMDITEEFENFDMKEIENYKKSVEETQVWLKEIEKELKLKEKNNTKP